MKFNEKYEGLAQKIGNINFPEDKKGEYSEGVKGTIIKEFEKEYKNELKNKFFQILIGDEKERLNNKSPSNKEQEQLNNIKDKYSFDMVSEKISCYSSARSDFTIGEDDSFRGYKEGYYTKGNYYQNWLPKDFYIYKIDYEIGDSSYFKYLVDSGFISNYVYSHQYFGYITFRKNIFSQKDSILNMINLMKGIENNSEKRNNRQILKRGFNGEKVFNHVERDFFDKKIAFKTAKNLRRIGRKYDKPELKRIMASEVFPSHKIKNEELKKIEDKNRSDFPFYYLLKDIDDKSEIKSFFNEAFNENEMSESRNLLEGKSIKDFLENNGLYLKSIFLLSLILEEKITGNIKKINLSFIEKEFGLYGDNIIDLLIKVGQLNDELILSFINKNIGDKKELISYLDKEMHNEYIIKFLKEGILNIEELYYFPKESVVTFFNDTLQNKESERYGILREIISKINFNRDKDMYTDIYVYNIYNNEDKNEKSISIFSYNHGIDLGQIDLYSEDDLKKVLLEDSVKEDINIYNILVQFESNIEGFDYLKGIILDYMKDRNFLESLGYTKEEIEEQENKKILIVDSDEDIVDVNIEKKGKGYEIYSFNEMNITLEFNSYEGYILYLGEKNDKIYVIRLSDDFLEKGDNKGLEDLMIDKYKCSLTGGYRQYKHILNSEILSYLDEIKLSEITSLEDIKENIILEEFEIKHEEVNNIYGKGISYYKIDNYKEIEEYLFSIAEEGKVFKIKYKGEYLCNSMASGMSSGYKLLIGNNVDDFDIGVPNTGLGALSEWWGKQTIRKKNYSSYF